MADSSITLALIAIVGTVITGLFKLLNDNTKALGKLVKSSEKVAEATQKSAKEAKQRNGHLGEQNVKIAELVTLGNETHHEILAQLQTSAQKAATLLKENTASTAHEVQIVAGKLEQNNET
jgi:hypothetical protein